MSTFVAVHDTRDLDVYPGIDCCGIKGCTMMFLAVLAVANTDPKWAARSS